MGASKLIYMIIKGYSWDNDNITKRGSLFFFLNIYWKKILYHSSENIKRILAIIVKCEICIVNYELQHIYDV